MNTNYLGFSPLRNEGELYAPWGYDGSGDYFLFESHDEPLVGHVNEDGSTWCSYVVLPKTAAAAREVAEEPESSQKTCDTCRHWKVSDCGQEKRLRCCERWLRGYGVANDDVPDNEVLVEDDEGWGAFMGPKFGCVLWETA